METEKGQHPPTLKRPAQGSEQPLNWIYVGMVSLVAAIGGLLFGFDTGVISGTIGGVVKEFNLNAWQEGFAVSNLIVACILAYGLMTLSMFCLGLMFNMKDIAPVWMVVPVVTYVASFACGVGVVIWVYLSEMFPNKIRGAAMGIATMLIWIANFAVTQFFPILRDKMGGSLFFLFTGLSLIAFLFTLIMMRETKGLHLEEIEIAFESRAP